MSGYWNILNVYSCQATVLYIGHERNVTEVSSNHMIGRTNSDVKFLRIDNHPQLTVIPGNLYQFFPNLESIMIVTTAIDKVSREDFYGLNEFKQFYLNNAKVTIIPSDLFIENPLMHSIYFNNMPIQHVGHRVFDHLPYLTSLWVANGVCINTYVNTNRATVLSIMFRLIVSCPPTFEMTEDAILNGQGFEKRIQPLVNKMLESERRIERLQDRLTALENKA